MSYSEVKSNFSVLAWVIAGLNSLGLVVAGGLYLVNPGAVQSVVQVEVLMSLTAVAVLYFASVHQFIKKRWLALSTAILAALSALNLALLIVQTGGLDSPFYAFWLLGIVAAGLFGGAYIAVLLAITAGGTIWVFAGHQFAGSYMAPKLGQFIITALAAGLAEWIHWRDRQPAATPTAVAQPQTVTKNIATDVLMRGMADGVIVVDNKGLIKLMNQAAEQMTGWDAASAKGLDYHSVMELKTADDQPVAADHDPFYRSGLERKSLIISDLSLYSRSGTKFELSISVSPITDSTNTPTGFVAVFRDVSKQKEVERQRSEFISTASHEMRTPVAAIEGYISLAMNPKVATIDDRAMQYLTKAHDNTQHLGALFRDLLSITKLEEGLTAMKLEPVNLSQMIKDLITDMQFAAQKKGITLTYGSSAAAGDRSVMPLYYVLAEPERLREVITNLIDNAIKFTSTGGVTVSVGGDPKIVTVRVTDTGPGISQENIQHLFQKFYRIDNSATRTAGGTGLGLYLARSIIELFNGRIWVESELGKGSSFIFSLVRTQPQPAAVAATQPQLSQVITPQTTRVLAPSSTPRGTIDGLRPAAKTT